MNLLIRAEAEAEVAALTGVLGQARIGYGQRFLDAVRKVFESIQTYPVSYARWEFGGKQRHLRRAVLRKFKTVIVFEVREANEEVEVFAVFNASRNPRYWMKRLKSAG